MKVLIVEDEKGAQDNLTEILSEIDLSIEIVGYTESVVDTVEWIQDNLPPDLIFMDIQLSDGSAFEILKRITVNTPVIFTTAYDQYALKAFKLHTIDYLLKPIDIDEMRAALEKFSKITNANLRKYIGNIRELTGEVKYAERILVPYRDSLVPVDVADISYIYTQNRNTAIYLSDGRSYKYNKSLDSIAQTLDPDQFFRANKQFIVSKKIKNIVVWSDNRLVIEMGIPSPEHIFVNKNRAASFRKWII